MTAIMTLMYDSHITYVWLQLWHLCMTPNIKLMEDSITYESHLCITYVFLTYYLCMTPIMKLMYNSIHETYVWLQLWHLCMTLIMKLMYDSIITLMYDSNYESYVLLHWWILCMTPFIQLICLYISQSVYFSINNSVKNIPYFFLKTFQPFSRIYVQFLDLFYV